jgi:hypothetical protein
VWQGAVLGGGDDRRERDALGAHVLRAPLERPRDGKLAVTDEPVLIDEPPVEAVGNLRRPANGGELDLVLDRAELLDEAARRDQLHPGRNQPGELRVLPDGDMGIVEPEPEAGGASALLYELCDGPEQVPLALDQLVVRRLVSRPLQVAKVGEQDPLFGPDQAEPVGPAEAAEVADVHEVRDEQEIERPFLQERREPVRAGPERAHAYVAHAACGGSTPSSRAIRSSASR